MAGGVWMAQNKIRPAAYINFTSVPRGNMTVGDRGIGLIPLALSWGAQGEMIEVLSTEMLSGGSLAKVGFTAFDTDSKLLNLMLQNCYKALVYRTNTGGAKATATLGDLIVTARYTGIFGNKITVSIVAIGARFEVKTFVDGVRKDSQIVIAIEDLTANDFVEFSGAGTLTELAGEPLTGGDDGTVPAPTAWMPEFLSLASVARWQTMAVPIKDPVIAQIISTFIDNQQNGLGRYVQAVVCDYAADHEGIINITTGSTVDGVNVSDVEATAWAAGITAGASITESNTNRVWTGATAIIGELDNEGIIEAVKNGEFIFSKRQDGSVKVEQDINSFTSFTPNKGYAFSKNRVIRTLHEIGTSITDIWERSYMGKIDNNATGRAIFKADIVAYLFELQRLGAITEFAGADDVTIAEGEKVDAVLAEIKIKPVDSMEFLYVNVSLK